MADWNEIDKGIHAITNKYWKRNDGRCVPYYYPTRYRREFINGQTITHDCIEEIKNYLTDKAIPFNFDFEVGQDSEGHLTEYYGLCYAIDNEKYAQSIPLVIEEFVDEPQKRHWFNRATDIVCPCCGVEYNDEIIHMSYEVTGYPNYCPNCGVKLDEPIE